jgi:rRNA-processing protein FCF1
VTKLPEGNHSPKNELVWLSSSLTSSPSKQTTDREIVVVVDTNSLLDYMVEILKLKNYKNLMVVVPLTVIHELDSIKKDPSIGYKARVALNNILQVMKEEQASSSQEEPWMRGQSVSEVLPIHQMGPLYQNNDDNILNCVLYYQKFVAKDNLLWFLTRDKALSVKAMMNGIQVTTVPHFLALLPTNTDQAPLKVNSPPQQPPPPPPSSSVVVAAQSDKQARPKKDLPKLPAPLWKKILSELDPRSLSHMSAVSLTFFDLIHTDDSVWRASIRKTFRDDNNILIPKNQSARQWYSKWRKEVLTYRM